MDFITPRSVTKLEEEIAELEKQTTQEEKVEETEEEAEETPAHVETETKEEGNWQKRYSDLRRLSQKQANDLKTLQTKIAELERQKTTVDLPSAEEAEAWAKANPKAASIIRAMFVSETSETKNTLDEVKREIERSKQEALIYKAHPDFEEITSSDDFHNWAEAQPQAVQNLVYNSSSADDVIWAISHYKSTKADKPNPKKEAAKAVASKSTTAQPKTQAEGRFSESQVRAMSMSEYEKNADAIAQAMRDGTFIYDLSGAAR